MKVSVMTGSPRSASLRPLSLHPPSSSWESGELGSKSRCSAQRLCSRRGSPKPLRRSPRGREASPPGERFRRDVLAAMPDIEATELVERFFGIGTKVVGSPQPVAIFLAGCRECLPECEIQVAGRVRAHCGGRNDDSLEKVSDFCQRGQNRAAALC